MTVGDVERSVDFYTDVFGFTKIGDREAAGQDIDRFYGLSDIHLRTVTLQLGKQTLELTKFISPKGRPIPPNLRSFDRSFQHIAIVVSNMKQAYQQLERYDGPYEIASNASSKPQALPNWN